MQQVKDIREWNINSPEGWVDFDAIIKNDPQVIYEYKDNKSSLKGSADHKVLLKGDMQSLKDVGIRTNHYENVYDILNAGHDHLYYANDMIVGNCSFMGHENALLTVEAMNRMIATRPILTMHDNHFKIYEEVIPEERYLCTVDPSEGVGGDFSVIQVLHIDSYGVAHQVAVYRCNTIELSIFPNVIVSIAELYNEALVIVENNSIGQAVTNELYNHLEYPELYTDDQGIGIRTTISTRRIGTRMLKELIEAHAIIIKDGNTIVEFSNFTLQGKIYKAASGYHDDNIMALSLYAYFTTTEYGQEFLNGNVLKHMLSDKIQSIEEDFPLPVVATNYEEAEGFNPIDR